MRRRTIDDAYHELGDIYAHCWNIEQAVVDEDNDDLSRGLEAIRQAVEQMERVIRTLRATR